MESIKLSRHRFCMSWVMLNQDQHKKIAMHIIYILEQQIIRNIYKDYACFYTFEHVQK